MKMVTKVLRGTESENASESKREPQTRMNNRDAARILIVDDEVRVREILSRKLADSGYECRVAGDGNMALKELGVSPPALVLLDISMPGKSGAEVLKVISAKYPDVAVIMVTAIADIDVAINSMKMGAYDYIIKPIDLKILSLSVDRALEKRSLILENREYQLSLEKKVSDQTRKIRQSFLNSITSLANALEAKDKYTHGHSQRVTKIAVAIAQELGMPAAKIEKISLAGLVHDIGKIGVRESVLNKPCKLTPEEFEHVKTHCEMGERILNPIIADKEVLEMVRHHHERYDGTGYPDALSGEQITKGTSIVAVAEALAEASDTMASHAAMTLAVADAYDSMTSARPYRAAMTSKAACAELERGKGRQFDPSVVEAIFKVLAKRGEL
jgi:putative two-component system response regulator